MHLRPVEEVILLCIRANLEPVQHDRLRHLLGSGQVDWPSLRAEATEQQVLPLVARVLTTPGLARTLPSAILQEAQAIRTQTLLRNMALHAELEGLSRLFSAHGLTVVPLKGTELTRRLYGTLDARWVSDIDILVPYSHLPASQSLLRALGYAPAMTGTPDVEENLYHGAPWMRQGPGIAFIVELHWQLSDPGFATIDYEHLWQGILAGSHHQAPLWLLPSEATLVFLALHFARHVSGLLRLLTDIDRLVRRDDPSLDWAAVLAYATRWQVTGLVYLALHWSQVFLATPVPDWLLHRLRPAWWQRAIVAFLTGPRAVLRPPTPARWRSGRFHLTYCALLSPARRAIVAYRRYLLPPRGRRSAHPFWGTVDTAWYVARGLAWTGLVVASALVDALALTYGRRQSSARSVSGGTDARYDTAGDNC